jgi:hypothetical protein
MNGPEMIVAIVIIVTIGGIIRARYGISRHDGLRPYRRARGYSVHHDDGATETENQRLRQELAAMKERLAVLERLATDSNDSGARLDREIEKLRDRS